MAKWTDRAREDIARSQGKQTVSPTTTRPATQSMPQITPKTTTTQPKTEQSTSSGGWTARLRADIAKSRQATKKQTGGYVQPKVPTTERDDEGIRARYAERHPEMTGGEAGARTREINSGWVSASMGKKKAQEEVDRLNDEYYWAGFVSTGPEDPQMKDLEKRRAEASKGLERAKSELAAWATARYYDLVQKDSERVKTGEGADHWNAFKNAGYQEDAILTVAAQIQEKGSTDPYVALRVQEMSELYGLRAEDFDAFNWLGNGKVNDTLKQLREKKEKEKDWLTASGMDVERYQEYELNVARTKIYEKLKENWRELADDHPVAASALTVATAPAQGLEWIINMVGNAGHDDPEDVSGGYSPPRADGFATEFGSTVRGTVSEGIKKKFEGQKLLGDSLSFLYQTGMSIADSAAQVAAMGPWATVVMATSAGANKYNEVIKKGGTADQALRSSLASAAAEFFFEKVSVDNLLKPKSITGWRSWVKETMKQGGVEASEELFTEIANILSDAAIMGEKSDFNQAVEQYKAQGLDEEEAKRKAYLDMVGQVALAGLGGAISGGVMGGVKGGYDAAAAGQQFSSLGGEFQSMGQEVVDAIIQEGLDSDPSTESYKMARELMERKNAGEEIKPKDLGRLYQTNVETIQAEEAAAQNAEEKGAAHVERTGRDTVNGLEAKAQELERGIAELNRQQVERGVEGLGLQGQATVKAMYLEGQEAGAYIQGMRELYAAGRAGLTMENVESEAVQSLNDHQRRAAYTAGEVDRVATENSQTLGNLDTEEELPFYFGSEEGAKGHEQAGELRVRDGGQRLDGAGTQGAVGSVEEGAGGDSAGADRAGPADAGAGALQVGRAISTYDLGVADGVKTDSLHMVTGGETEAIRQIKAEAAQRGLELVLFTGGNMHVRVDQGGEFVTVEARGYISGNKVYIRADHGEFTANQLWRHELYHDMVAAGEVNPRATMEATRELLGDELTDKLEEAYSRAMGGLKGVELWEEIAADQHGGMNVFSGTGTAIEGEMEALGVLVGTQTDAQMANSQTAQATDQRTGPPQGQQTAAEQKPSGGRFSQEHRGQMTAEELAAVQRIGRKSVNELTSEELSRVETFARRYYQELGEKSPFFRAWFGDWRVNDQTQVRVVQVDRAKEYHAGKALNADTGWSVSWGDTLKGETKIHGGKGTMAMLGNIDSIVQNAVLLDSEISGRSSKNKMPGTALMHSMYALIDDGEGMNLYKLYVEEAISQRAGDAFTRAYALKDMKKVANSQGVLSVEIGEGLTQGGAATEVSVADLFQVVKARDKAFSPKDASKVVDAEGKPLVVYHGSSKKDITVFDSRKRYSHYRNNAVFFTPDVEYAKSAGFGRDGKVYAAYLDIKNPFILDRAGMKVGDVSLDEEYMGTGSEKVFDALKEQGYDGLILGEDAETAGEIVVFDPAQIKSATDNIGTFDRENPDIRFSRESSDYIRELRELQKENETLKKRLDYWMGQTRLSGGPTVDHTAVRTEAAKMIDQLGVKGVTVDEAATQLQNIYDLISTGRQGGNELSYGAVREMAEDLARDLLSRAVEKDDSTYREYSGVRDYFKDTQIILSETDSRDIPDYGDWRRRQGRRIKLRRAQSGEMSNVDSVFHEAASMWPELFSEAETSTASDQVRQIAEVLGWIYQITEVNPYSSYMEEAVQWTANDIIEAYGDLPMGEGTIADQWQAKVHQAQAQGREAVRQQRLVDDMYYGRKMAQTRRWARERVDRVVAYEKARTEAKVAELKAWYKGRDAEVRERQKNSEARNRLLKLTQRLERMKTTTANKALIRELMGEIDTAARSLTGTKRLDLEQLRRDYQDYQNPNSERYNPDFIPDARTEKSLERLSRKHIDDMTQQDVEDLNKALLNLEHEIRTSKRLLQEEEARSIYQLGSQIIDEMEAVQGSKTSGVSGTLDKYLTGEVLSPMRMVRRMVGWNDSSPLLKATEALNKGQRVMLDYQMRAEKPFLRFAKDKVFTQEFSGTKAKEVKIGGWTKDGLQEVAVTPAMRASIYLHSLNQQNARHMAEGGVTVPDMKLYKKGDLAEAYARGTTVKIKPSDTQRLFRQMSETERAFVREVQKYFGGMSQTELSKVAEALRGYAPTMVEHYFPIVTNKNFMKQEITFDADGTATILKPGYMEERINASGPMMLQDVDSVVNHAIQQHGLFVGMAIPVRNFNKLWNVSTAGMTEAGDYYSYAGSVKEAVDNTWGSTGKRYIEKMVKDVQGRQHANDQWGGWMDKLRSNYAGAVLTINASVAIKQAASYPTAAAVLGWKPLMQAMGNVGRVDLDLIAKYTPLQWYRSKGFASKELGDMARNNSRMPKLLNWIQGMDLLTTRKLWKASEYYVRDHNKTLKVGSDAYYQAVAEVYNQVIEETQPNYTAMQRPQLLRSESDLMKNLAMFKTQPMQNLNILYDAAGDFLAKRRQFKAGQIGAETMSQSGRNLGNAVTSQLVQAGVFAAMGLAWAWLRGRMDKYKDKDKDEVTLEALMKALGVDAGLNLVSGIPIIPDLGEYFVKKVQGERAYSLDVTSVSLIMDTVDAVSKVTKLAVKVLTGEESDIETMTRTLWDTAEDISKALGIPMENVTNLFNAGYRHTVTAAMGQYRGEHEAMKMTTDMREYPADFYDNLYKAMVNDRAAYQDIYEDMVKHGISPEKIKSAMEKRMKTAQGVGSVGELDHRYVAPDDEADFAKAMKRLEGSKLWRKASPEQQDKAEGIAYELVTGDSKSTMATLDKLAGAGVDEGTYALYKLAAEMADEASDDNGSITNAEREAAIRSIDGISDAMRAALWVVGGGKDKSNPWG